MREDDTRRECQRILGALAGAIPVLTVKLYRVALPDAGRVPVLPCLDHEAVLRDDVAPHMAVYLRMPQTDGLHELVFEPARRRVEVDALSTWGENSDASRDELAELLHARFPEYRVMTSAPAWWRGDRRVVEACRARVSLRDVLLGGDFAAVGADVARLQTVGTLMEKNSRVASWGVRTVTGPLLAAAGVVSYQVLGTFTPRLGAGSVVTLRSLLVGLLGAVFLYYGLKAVQLTSVANRVWKRSAEYALILAERRRLGAFPAAESEPRPGPPRSEDRPSPRR